MTTLFFFPAMSNVLWHTLRNVGKTWRKDTALKTQVDNIARRAMYVQSNTEASPRNHCHRGRARALNILRVCQYSCLGYAASKAHAPHYIICDLSDSTAFFHTAIKVMIFRKTKKLLNIKCMLWSLQLWSETFLNLRILQRDLVINVQRSLCKVPVILVRF